MTAYVINTFDNVVVEMLVSTPMFSFIVYGTLHAIDMHVTMHTDFVPAGVHHANGGRSFRRSVSFAWQATRIQQLVCHLEPTTDDEAMGGPGLM